MEIVAIPGFYEPFSSLSHLLASGGFLILTGFTLYKGRGSWPRVIGLAVFCLFTVTLFVLSGVFHLLEKGSTASHVLKILDHSAIYTMIAGSFTPFQIIMLRGSQRWLPLLLIWSLAITGLTLTAVYFDSLSEGLLLCIFLIMGWMGLFTLVKVWRISLASGKLLATGCLFYTFGALADFADVSVKIHGVFGAHEQFHLLIIIAALCHWLAIHRIAHFPVTDRLKVLVKEYPHKLQAYVFGKHYILTATNQFELKQKLSAWLNTHYPPAIRPQQVKFEFAKEEWMSLQPTCLPGSG